LSQKRWLPMLGVLGGAILLVNLNVLGARWYKRWDFTADRLYSLSQPTRELLRSLESPARDQASTGVDVVVLLSRNDPLTVSVRHMLEAYGAETTGLRVRYVDPDRSPAEFLAVQQKYRILAGKADDGRIVTDAAIVVAQGERHWFVTGDELVRLDEDSGRSRPALEQALSGAIANVLGTVKAKLCFTTGHREPTLDDAGPEGLSELKQRLLKNNYDVASVDTTSNSVSFDGCRAIVVATPELQFGAEEARRVADYVQSGGSAVLLLSPGLDESQLVRGTGLEPVLSLAGLSVGRDLVLETDEAQRLPRGSGELFFATLLPHPVTRGVLHEAEKLSSRVLVAQARSVSAGKGSSLLLQSSAKALAIEDLSALSDPSRRQRLTDSAVTSSFGLAAAAELPKPSGSQQSYGPRLFLSGASNLAWNRNFQDPALYGNRRLLENALSWVAARPSMLSVPEKPEREVGLSLSEQSLGEVMRYVLLYMPGSAALLGAFVILRRRNAEKQSRSAGGGGAAGASSA